MVSHQPYYPSIAPVGSLIFGPCTVLCEEDRGLVKDSLGIIMYVTPTAISRFNSSEIIFVHQVRRVNKSLNLYEPIYCLCRIENLDYIGFFLALQYYNYIILHDHPTHWFSQKQKIVLEYVMMNYIYIQEMLIQIILKAFMNCVRLTRLQSLRVKRT